MMENEDDDDEVSSIPVEARVARLNEFATFLEGLPEEKFDIGGWCAPNHTCKTVACIGGWATLNYTEEGKDYLTKAYDVSRYLERERYDVKDILFWDDPEYQRLSWIKSLAEPFWVKTGREALYLTEDEADMLFYRLGAFWDDHIPTNKEAAAALRWIASHPIGDIVCLTSYREIATTQEAAA